VGIIRKMASICTVGLIDYRSDKERTARYTKQLRDDQREANKRVQEAQGPAEGQGAASQP
jgi:hypothetical protein